MFLCRVFNTAVSNSAAQYESEGHKLISLSERFRQDWKFPRPNPFHHAAPRV